MVQTFGYVMWRAFVDFIGNRSQDLVILFQNWEVTIDNCVDHGIGQVVCAPLPNASFASTDSSTHRIETIARMFLKCDQRPLQEKHADLLSLEGLDTLRHPQHDEDICVVRVCLGTLIYIDYIFKRERM